jgi:hypothetical protein
MIEESVIEGLIGNPSESLNVEVKRWIDPTQPRPWFIFKNGNMNTVSCK